MLLSCCSLSSGALMQTGCFWPLTIGYEFLWATGFQGVKCRLLMLFRILILGCWAPSHSYSDNSVEKVLLNICEKCSISPGTVCYLLFPAEACSLDYYLHIHPQSTIQDRRHTMSCCIASQLISNYLINAFVSAMPSPLPTTGCAYLAHFRSSLLSSYLESRLPSQKTVILSLHLLALSAREHGICHWSKDAAGVSILTRTGE